MCSEKPRTFRFPIKRVYFCILLLYVGSFLGQRIYAQPSVGRPIIFVHGWCDTAESWATLQTSIGSYVNKLQPNLYPDTVPWTVYYDTNSKTVKVWPSGLDFASTVPRSARFFSVNLFDPTSSNFATISPGNAAETENVAQVSILNKGNELAQIIDAIASLTLVKDSIIVAHSQGGLDTRAYIENLATSNSCTDQDSYSCLKSPATLYTQDINKLITLDTPHGGALSANWVSWLPGTTLACFATDTLNRRELQEGSAVIRLLTQSAMNAPLGLSIASIQSYTSPGFNQVLGPDGDEVVTVQEQSIQTIAPSVSNYYDVPDFIGPYFPFYLPPNTVLSPLHQLPVLSAQSITTNSIEVELDKVILHGTPAQVTSITVQAAAGVSYQLSGPTSLSGAGLNTFYDLPVGAYTLSYPGGKIQGTLGVDHSTGNNNWNLIFYVPSQVTAGPSVSTLPATLLGSDGANLNGTVNPNGLAGTAWFEYGTASSLNTFTKAPVQSLLSGTGSVPFAYGLSGKPPNTKYYYRAAANNAAGTVRDTNILSFTTLNALAAPTLSVPANGASGQSTTPQLAWTAVPNATVGYRIMMSTSSAALPTDPNSDICAYGCALGVNGDTATGTTYTPPTGSLLPSTTYFWEVHGRGTSQAGAWSQIWSFTTGTATKNDFSLQVTPTSQSVAQGGSVTYNVTTATTSGSSQSVSFAVSNLPAGMTPSFSPASVSSGTQTTLTLTASSSLAAGPYTLTITGTGTGSSHSYQVSVNVTAAPSGPAVTVNPSIVRFNDQAVGSVSSPQTVLLLNTGSGQLKISSIALAAGSDYVLTLPNPLPPNILNALVPYNIQVSFAPNATGPRSGSILIYDNAPDSPQIVKLTGGGLPAAPSTGTINVSATLNGVALPAGYSFGYTLNGPTSYTGGGAYSFAAAPGTYSVTSSGYPSFLTLATVSPSGPQLLAAGGTIGFVLNFTAPSDFYAPSFGAPANSNGVTAQIVTAGATAQYPIIMPNPPQGNASVPVTLTVVGTPTSSTPTFSPQPAYTGQSSNLSITTGSAPGVYALSLSGTNANGLSHGGSTSALVVTTPPASAVKLVSQSSGSVQGNGTSSISPGSVSGDGRYVVFSSSATDLISTSGGTAPAIFLRDLTAGTTALVSISNSGIPANGASSGTKISANGRYVVFSSFAQDLASGVGNGNQAIFVRDWQAGMTEREDVASDGTPGNGNSYGAVISPDGRFVSFLSSATNLVPGATGIQAYLRDRTSGKIVLGSANGAGSAANGTVSGLAMSADGRFLAFDSSATNLVSLPLGGQKQAFYRDTVSGTTSLLSSAPDGSAGNAPVTDESSGTFGPLAMSADGRFVVFNSSATNLTAAPLDGSIHHLFIRDAQLSQTSLVDSDSVGMPLGGWSSFSYPAISADGRFVTFSGFLQTLIRDTVQNQTAVISLAGNGSAGNESTGSPDSAISANGSVIAFDSLSSNLVPNDTNGVQDAFLATNPFLGPSAVQSLALAAQTTPGGVSESGTITLSGAAPVGGAIVTVWSNNAAAQPPNTVFIPAGATSATFNIATSLVSTESIAAVLASYNGGSSVAMLAVEPSAVLNVSPPSWDFGNQQVAISSVPQVFSISNSGTASLPLNSVQLSLGQVFKTSGGTCGTTLPPASACSIAIAFDPTASGGASDALQVSYGVPATLQSVSLSGNGAVPIPSVTPTALTLTSPTASTGTTLLTNTGNAPLSGISVAITGANPADFSLASDGCSGTTLPANASCLVNIVFVPSSSGTRSAVLSLNTSASANPQLVNLTGTQSQLVPTIIWNPSAASVTFGTALGTNMLDATATANGVAVAGSFVYTANSGGGTQLVVPSTVLSPGIYSLSVAFTPSDTTDYSSAVASVTLTVTQASQTIAFAPPSSLTFGMGPISLSAVGGGSGNPITFAVISGPGSITGSNLTVTGAGTIVVSASQAGNANFAAANPTTASIIVAQAAQTISFAPPVSSNYGAAPIPLAATGGASGNPVNFTLISGPGSITGSALTITGTGTITVAADQMGNSNYLSAPEVVRTIVVSPEQQVIAFPALPSPVSYGAVPITLIATGGNSGNPVVFNVASGPGSIRGSQVSFAGAGNVVITANQSGNANFAAATPVSQTIVVSPASVIVTASNATRSFGASNPPLTGSVSGSVNGDSLSFVGTTTASITSDVGKYAIVPSITGANAASYIVTPVSGTLTITPTSTTVFLSSSNANANLGSAVTLSAMVSSSTTGTPSGVVTFAEGNNTLGTVSLVQGTATLVVSSLTAGQHLISASYQGATDFTASISSVLSQNVVAPDYIVSVNPTALTIKQGSTGTATFAIAPLGAFNQTVLLSCSGLPIHSSCTFSPSTISGGSAGSSTMTITTNVNTASLEIPGRSRSVFLAMYSGNGVFCASLLLYFTRRKKLMTQHQRLLLFLIGIGLLSTMGFTLSGCGSSPAPLPLTPVGSTMVVVTASTSGGSGLTHSATLNLTIAP